MNWRTVLHVAVACADIQTVDLILEVKRIALELLDCIMDKEAESSICFFFVLIPAYELINSYNGEYKFISKANLKSKKQKWLVVLLRLRS